MTSIELLADRPELASVLATMQWEEWSKATGERLGDWIAIAQADVGKSDIPVGFIAVHDAVVVGGVSLRAHDIPQRRDRSPWVCGTIVHPDWRGRGIGRLLMARLHAWAHDVGIVEGWVWTGHAASFYERFGWRPTERLFHEALCVNLA